MSQRSRLLQVGDQVVTDYSSSRSVRRMTLHTITDRKETDGSQSGVMFRVSPIVTGSGIDAWMDADWFEPVKIPCERCGKDDVSGMIHTCSPKTGTEPVTNEGIENV